MNNWLLFFLLAVLVMVNVYFTYRRTTDLDPAGRKLLAACQLLYLVFIVIIFGVAKLFNLLGFAKKMQAGGGSWPVYIGSIAAVGVVLAVFVFFKAKLEKKIREEHSI